MKRIFSFIVVLASAFALPSLLPAQLTFDLMGVQVTSYFPQIAVGGGNAQSWTTSFTFTNPHPTHTAEVWLHFMDENGGDTRLDCSGEPQNQVEVDFKVAPQGTVTFTCSSRYYQVGWAWAVSSLPVQGVALYRVSVNGVPQQGVSVPSTPASAQFYSPATSTSGIALAIPRTLQFR